MSEYHIAHANCRAAIQAGSLVWDANITFKPLLSDSVAKRPLSSNLRPEGWNEYCACQRSRRLPVSEIPHTPSHQLKTALTAGIWSRTARTPGFEHDARSLFAAHIRNFLQFHMYRFVCIC